jgi:hypothetical protein
MSAEKNYGDPIDPRPLDPDDVAAYMAESDSDIDMAQPQNRPDLSNPDDIDTRMALEDEGGPEFIGDEGSVQEVDFQGGQQKQANQPIGDEPQKDPDQYLSGSEDDISFGAL